MVGVSYQRVPCLAKANLKHFKWEHFCLIGGNRAIIHSKKSLLTVVGKPIHNILLNLGDLFSVRAFLPHWR